MSEERKVDPDTGGEKGAKLARFDLLPAQPLYELAEHYGRGSRKYEDRNWERGYAWSLSFAALMRHAWEFWGGEDVDPETGTKHIIAVAWHALALAEFMETHPEKDDRPKIETTGAIVNKTMEKYLEQKGETGYFFRDEQDESCFHPGGLSKAVADHARHMFEDDDS